MSQTIIKNKFQILSVSRTIVITSNEVSAILQSPVNNEATGVCHRYYSSRRAALLMASVDQLNSCDT